MRSEHHSGSDPLWGAASDTQLHMELGWLENMSCSVVLVGVREVGGVGEVSVFCVVSEVNV